MGGSDTHDTEDQRRPPQPKRDGAGRLRPRLRAAGIIIMLVGLGTAVVGYAGVLSASSTGTSTGTATSGFITEAESLAPETGTFAACPDCHAFLDPPAAERPFLNEDFGHKSHIERGAVCEDCHVTPVHTEQGTRRPGMADCFGCHDQNPGAAAPGECSLCHPADMPLVPSSHTDDFFAGGHAEVVELDGPRECFVCHEGDEQTFCQSCHGIALPHPEGWVGTEGPDPGDHVDWAYQDAMLCVTCHANTDESAPPGCYEGECHGPR